MDLMYNMRIWLFFIARKGDMVKIKTLIARVSSLKLRTKILIAVVAFLVVGGMVTIVILMGGRKNDDEVVFIRNEDNSVTVDDETIFPPAANTSDLKKRQSKLSAEVVDQDKIEFRDDVGLSVGEKIAVWVYSEPKFLGFFEIKVVGGVKYIEGLAEAIANLNIEPGVHNIAIVTSEGRPVGYIDIYIEDGGEIKEEKPSEEGSAGTEKNEVVEEKIAFASRTENEVNMLRGVTKITQVGKDGVKRITYSVKYDKDGKEVSRVKIEEKISRQAVEQVTKIGVSDFNMNTDIITGLSGGQMCLPSEYSETYGCGMYVPTNKSFFTFTLKGKNYLFCAADDNRCVGATDVPVTIKPALSVAVKETTAGATVSEAMYAGSLHILDYAVGMDDPPALTEATCAKYGLACGRW